MLPNLVYLVSTDSLVWLIARVQKSQPFRQQSLHVYIIGEVAYLHFVLGRITRRRERRREGEREREKAKPTPPSRRRSDGIPTVLSLYYRLWIFARQYLLK